MAMEILCSVLEKMVNPIIFLVALIELGLMVKSVFQLSDFKRRINKLNKKDLKGKIVDRKEEKGVVKKLTAYQSNYNWEEFDQFLEDYQQKGSTYSSFSMIIQIFTLLGILGTVAGLYIAMSNETNLYEGVSFALSSTVLGIIFAVVYKIADIVIASHYIEYIEDGINRYEKIYAVDNESAEKNAGGYNEQ